MIWRTNNWGEPRIDVASYSRSKDLKLTCNGDLCEHDEILLSGLEQKIRESSKQKVFVVLHQSGSHGPSYYSKYPEKHERFKPTCQSVDLKNCSSQELVNAYDNTLVFTDYLLARTISLLETFQGVSTALMYISDHGESLGEHGLYLHGAPLAIAPKEQVEIPFLLWMSKPFRLVHNVSDMEILNRQSHSQSNIFHSVLSGFSLSSDIYVEDLDVFYRVQQ